ncbi:MAG: alkaline phosphatase [Pontiellaceae bacterium]|nr:alkaline phosphatase [Pontiellaceae bacterium]MBN2785032.1 alkaline phosphatase [Pontiellaceae bacterium]
MRKYTALLASTLALMTVLPNAKAQQPRRRNPPRYVFFFLGDGMSSAQVLAAEAYKSGNEDDSSAMRTPEKRLNMTQMPATGLATTFCDTRLITDSAAAATAFACGIKTTPGAIGRNTELNASFHSIAELAQTQGRAIGIVSSVSLSHATPAGYYANVNSRNNYCEIGYQASQSGFEFFGGGLFPQMDSDNNSGKIKLQQAFADAGYTILRKKDEILGLNGEQGKVVCSVATSYDGDAMPFSIDHPEEDFSLAEITQVAINYLQNDPEGFFILVEGGKIDWACHGNDAATALQEVIAFDNAIGTALNFMTAHPNETLIVVTGDHETGGLSIGFRGNKYQTDLARLRGQTKSGVRFIATDLAAYKKSHKWIGITESNIDDEMKSLIKSCFGLEWNDLTAFQKEQLERAYDYTMSGKEPDSRPSGYDLEAVTSVDYLTYGGTDPLTVTITHILANEAGLDWTTSSHTALPVPVFAAGAGARSFSGFYDNTDIAKKLGRMMQLPEIPAEDESRKGPSAY